MAFAAFGNKVINTAFAFGVCTIPILKWVAANMPNSMVNIMGQYRPEHKVRRDKERFADIARPVNSQEMETAFNIADELGIYWRPVS